LNSPQVVPENSGLLVLTGEFKYTRGERENLEVTDQIAVIFRSAVRLISALNKRYVPGTRSRGGVGNPFFT